METKSCDLPKQETNPQFIGKKITETAITLQTPNKIKRSIENRILKTPKQSCNLQLKCSSTKANNRLNTKARFYCRICDKDFSGKFHFIKHSQYHKGEKPFPSNECSKWFIENSKLKRPYKNQTIKSYKCDRCGKQFKSKNYTFKRHYRIHTGEKPFKCNMLQMHLSKRQYDATLQTSYWRKAFQMLSKWHTFR